MNFLERISRTYNRKNLDFDKAIEVWSDNKLSSMDIQAIVASDINELISSDEANELFKISSESKKSEKSLSAYGIVEKDSDINKSAESFMNEHKDSFIQNQEPMEGNKELVKPYKVSEGSSDLLPYNIKNRDKLKFTPSTRMAMEKIGENLYRDKIASKFWTLKERIGDDGSKQIYLVAVETDDNKKD